jgi:hypothetical protein
LQIHNRTKTKISVSVYQLLVNLDKEVAYFVFNLSGENITVNRKENTGIEQNKLGNKPNRLKTAFALSIDLATLYYQV